jgi:hypothetical protein
VPDCELKLAVRMVWSGGMPLGLFKGERTYTQAPSGAGGTRFNMREEHGGPMLGMIRGSIPTSVLRSRNFAQSLKRKAEASA